MSPFNGALWIVGIILLGLATVAALLKSERVTPLVLAGTTVLVLAYAWPGLATLAAR